MQVVELNFLDYLQAVSYCMCNRALRAGLNWTAQAFVIMTMQFCNQARSAYWNVAILINHDQPFMFDYEIYVH